MANTHEYIGNVIADKMKEKGVSLRGLSAKTNTVYGYQIHNIKNGKDCNVSTLFQLLDALGLEITINEKI